MKKSNISQSVSRGLRSTDYLHGVEHLYIDDAEGRPIAVVRASVVGMVGVSEDADAATFPLNKPVLVNSEKFLAKAGTGPMAEALEDIYRQSGALVVVVRTEGDDVVGSVDEFGEYTGMQALLAAESAVGIRPTLLMLAVGKQDLTDHVPALGVIANKLHAIPFTAVLSAGPEAAIKAADSLDGFVVGYDMMQFGKDKDGKVIERDPCATMVGHMLRVDGEEGYWNSPSSRVILGLTGMRKPVDHAIGSTTTTANRLSEGQVCCVVRQDGGFYWFGNKLTGPKKMLIPHQRIRWTVGLSIQMAHQDFLDRNMTANYIETVKGRVNNLLRRLVRREVISGGECWVDSEENIELIGTNNCVWRYDLGFYDVAERMTFIQSVNRTYTEAVFG